MALPNGWWNRPTLAGELAKLHTEIYKRFPNAITWRDVLAEIDRLQRIPDADDRPAGLPKALDSVEWARYRSMKKPDNSVFYGGGGTIHHTTKVNVETRNGKVVSVWFRCCALPFDQTDVKLDRAGEMIRMYKGSIPELVGVNIVRKEPK